MPHAPHVLFGRAVLRLPVPRPALHERKMQVVDFVSNSRKGLGMPWHGYKVIYSSASWRLWMK